jgi:photosynthetic reaction center cytochrome c subunit
MRTILSLAAVVATVLLTGAMVLTAGWVRPPIRSAQLGFRGLAMEQNVTPSEQARLKAANVVPEASEQAPAGGPLATTEYQNVKVLTDLTTDQFNRVMLSITEWVAPEQGCAYCHNVENLADDGLYTKTVARRMLQMTRAINNDWKAHVAETGVTCYTCHRGNPVPQYVWYNNPGPAHANGFAADRQGQNVASKAAGMSSLPYTAIDNLLTGGSLRDTENIRVVSTTALPEGTGKTIKQTEQTYSLMMHMSEGLGVNCTFCHNSRAFSQWQQSTPQRATAWHGIQMVRDLNAHYLDPLKPTYPPNRLGVLGDAPKANCATCHQGVNKPLYGVSMVKDYPELGAGHKATP